MPSRKIYRVHLKPMRDGKTLKTKQKTSGLYGSIGQVNEMVRAAVARGWIVVSVEESEVDWKPTGDSEYVNKLFYEQLGDH